LISDLYPNPADNEIRFTTSIDQAYLITIYNSIGKIIKTIEVNEDDLGSEVLVNTESLARGSYFIKIDNHDGYFVSKKFQKR